MKLVRIFDHHIFLALLLHLCTGVVPHAAIGNARWLPVESFKKDGQAINLQHERMREAVENQSPHVVIVDEISTQAVRLEASVFLH